MFLVLDTESRGWYFRLVFGSSQVQITARRQAILSDVFVVLQNPSRQLPGYFLKLDHSRFLIFPFKLADH
jgi:hypothetical protein